MKAVAAVAPDNMTMSTLVDDDVRVLARMDHPELGDTPVVWVTRHGEGRVAYCSLGHDRTALTDPGVETLLERAVAWAAGEGGQ